MGHTYKNPAIVSTSANDGVNQSRYDSAFRITFASPMDIESMKGKVQITPPILGDPDGLYNEWNWSSYYYGLEPSTEIYRRNFARHD